MSPGIAGDQGLAIGPEQSAASWKAPARIPFRLCREIISTRQMAPPSNNHNHEKLRLSTYLNGKLIASLNMDPDTVEDLRWETDLGGLGSYGSNQVLQRTIG